MKENIFEESSPIRTSQWNNQSFDLKMFQLTYARIYK